jgi:signal transduction histidine kinase
VADGVRIGVLGVGPKRQDVELSGRDAALIATAVPLVATALQNVLLLQELHLRVAELQDRESALGALSLRLMQVQEEERARLALDLHDDPLQRAILLTRAMNSRAAGAVARRWRKDAEEIIVSLRAICAGLRPPVLDDFGLVEGLEWVVNDLRARSDLSASLTVTTNDRLPFGRLDVALEVALYRVAQEALNNCLKHSGADQVVVTLTREEDRVALSVVDNGCGFELVEGEGAEHLGVLGMRERLRPWYGVVTLATDRMGGTVVTAMIPRGVPIG